MEQNTFVDRFFHSSCELTDFRKTGERDINTLFSFLNNLHSLQDRVREQFGKTISQHPEFKLLRIIRNYHHHVGDVDEFRVFNTRNEFSFSHSEMIIIPLFVVAKAIVNAKKNLLEKRRSKQYQSSSITLSIFQRGILFFLKSDISLIKVKNTIQGLTFINAFITLQILLLTSVVTYPSFRSKNVLLL